jgi:hypothetical protein
MRGNSYLGNLFALIPFILGAVVLLSLSEEYSEVARRQQAATGTIVRQEPSNHNRCGYTFEVDGHGYSGWDTPVRREPSMGQRVRVYYDPRNPATNALTDFDERSYRMRGPAIAILLLSAIVAAGVLVLSAIRWVRNKGNPPEAGSGLFSGSQ